MQDQLKGAIGTLLVVILVLLVWKGAAEYRYYQTVKREHQEFFLNEFGRTPEGKPFTRKMYFDALVLETIKAQQLKAKQARTN